MAEVDAGRRSPQTGAVIWENLGKNIVGRAGSRDTDSPWRQRKEKHFLGISGTLQTSVRTRKSGLPAQQAAAVL